MTQTSAPWDGISVGDATTAPYSADEWAHLWALLQGVGSIFPNYGVIRGTGDGTYDPLQVIASGSANVDVKIGSALIQGKIYENTAAVTLTVAANASGNPRIDTLVLRVDYVAQTIRAVLKQGTPAGSPTPPALTQSAGVTWEIPLANIAVANGFSTIAQADITDRRRATDSTNHGWHPYVYMDNYIPGNAYSSGDIWTTGIARAMPFSIAGNMLVEQLVLMGRGNSSPNITWGIYVQNANDGGANDKNVVRIGGRDTAATTSVTNGSRVAFPAIPAPIPLAPGSYWLVMLVKDANLTIGVVNPIGSGSFDENAHLTRGKGSVISLGQTIDLNGYSASANTDDSYALRLEGRVFGETTAF